MIFARRALQRRATALRAALDHVTVDNLASRLNRPGKDRLAAMWEIVVLHSLAGRGEIRSEDPLPSGRRPDIVFKSDELSFTADVTIVSDDGLDEQNPYRELSARIETLKNRLGLPIGGLNLQIKSRRDRVGRGERTRLRLPDRARLDAFVKERIEPALRAQVTAGETVLRLSIDDDVAGIDLVIDPSQSPYSSGGYAAYDVPTVKDRNPLYNVLKAKARQLRGARGITGIVVGDGNSTALRDRQRNGNGYDAQDIVREFMRQNSSIDFVFLISVREKQRSLLQTEPSERTLHGILEVSPNCPAALPLGDLFRAAMDDFPKPTLMPVNAAHRAKKPGYGWGHHGGHQMSGSRVKISARELMEVLAGRRTVNEMNEAHGWRSAGMRPSNTTMFNPFDRALSDARLPAKMTVIETDENDYDNWIEIEFGDPDPAISPIR